MRIVLLGLPGCGKSTQAELLSKKYKVPHIKIGELLKDAVESGTDMGRLAKQAMDAGVLAPDSIVISILKDRLQKPDAKNGFILEGFPRNLTQAEALQDLLQQIGITLDMALLIQIEVDMIIQRLSGRRHCRTCGYVHNVFINPPALDDQCDMCGGNLHHRADDKEETISNRMRIFELQTLPLIENFKEQSLLRTVQAAGDIDTIANAIFKLTESVKTEKKKKQQNIAKKIAAAHQQSKAKQDSTEKQSAETKPTAKAKKKAVTSKKVAAKKKPAAKKKAVAKKSTAKKKAPVKKKAAAKKTASKKAVTKKSVAKKKAAAKKKIPAKKKPAAKKKAVTKKSAAKKKAAAKKKKR